MSKEIYISSTPHETRLAIVEDDNLAEIYYERENEYTLAGSIYNGRVTRVLPGMQSSFVEIGLERDAFLYITDFMEEAGDSADFETTHGGGDPRPARSDSQRGDNQRRDRPDRGERPAPLTLEGSAASAGDRSEEGRGDRPERGERTGRGRNRRGRGDRGPAVEHNDARVQEGQSQTPRITEDAAPDVMPPVSADAGEVGEGAPGADGSRRWRGRRGRRRRRTGNGQPEDVSRDTNAAAEPVEGEFVGNESADENEGTPEVIEAAAPLVVNEAYAAEEPSRSAPQRQESGNGQRRDFGRGGRNDRDGGKGRNDRGGRSDRGPRVPRGFAPSLDLYGVDATATEGEAIESTGEPIILPGESLSKYRRGLDAETTEIARSSSAVPANVILAKPTTVVDDSFVASAWDGGAVLPGETLSRRNRPEQRREPSTQYRTHSQTAQQSNFRAPAPVRTPEIVEDAEGLSVAAVAEEQPEVAGVAHFDQVPSREILHETPSPFTESVPAPLDPIAAVPEPAAPEAEYEPKEASASYRVDPVAPSEFRQSATVLEEPVEEFVPRSSTSEHLQEETIHVDHSHPFNRLDEADTQPETSIGFAGESVGQHGNVPELDTTGVPPRLRRSFPAPRP